MNSAKEINQDEIFFRSLRRSLGNRKSFKASLTKTCIDLTLTPFRFNLSIVRGAGANNGKEYFYDIWCIECLDTKDIFTGRSLKSLIFLCKWSIIKDMYIKRGVYQK